VDDVNDDGVPDLLVGAPGVEVFECSPCPAARGRAYVFSGATRELLFTLDSPNGEHQGAFGRSVANAGDTNGDGRPEVLVGAPSENPGASPTDAGRAYVFSLPPVSPTQPGPHEAGLRLLAPRPHPLHDRGTIDFELGEAGHARLALLDVLGREVMVLINARMAAGLHSAQIDASALRPGIYMARLELGGAAVNRRVTVVR
jgi:hypothetical protein